MTNIIFEELKKLRDARLKAERSIFNAAGIDVRNLPVDRLLELEKIHDEIEELHELMLCFLYKYKARELIP
jgi:hypothetical protein